MSQDKIQLLTADRVKWRLAVKLKVKNLGTDTIQIYNDLISFYYKKNYNFVTIKDYAKTLTLWVNST